MKTIKELEKGCGYDFNDGDYCSEKDELCEICKGKIESLVEVMELLDNYFTDNLDECPEDLKELKSAVLGD